MSEFASADRLGDIHKLQVEASASALFLCLEKQGTVNFDWQYLENMNPYLMQLMPLDRQVREYNTAEGLKLRQVTRSYNPQKAKQLLYEIGYRGFVQDLQERGYDYTKNKFVQLCVAAARAHQFYSR